MFECQFPDGIRRTIALLRSLNPVWARFDDDLSTSHTECLGTHSATQFGLGIQDDEVVDALLVKRPGRNDTRHATTEDKDGSMIGGILSKYT